MTKKLILLLILFVITVVLFFMDVNIDGRMGSAALTFPSFTHTRCVDNKCLVASGIGISQCSANVNCATHMQYNTVGQCVATSGAGPDLCAGDKKFIQSNDPQQWCKLNNVGPGLNSTAIKYPNGNFTCECFYITKLGTHAQTPCINSHFQ